MVVVDRQITIVNEAHKRCPPAKAVIDCACDRRAVGGTLPMQCEPPRGGSDQRLAFRARPFAADVAMHREHARRVVQLLGGILADALERTAPGACRVGGFVTELGAWQIHRKRPVNPSSLELSAQG